MEIFDFGPAISCHDGRFENNTILADFLRFLTEKPVFLRYFAFQRSGTSCNRLSVKKYLGNDTPHAKTAENEVFWHFLDH